MKHSRMDDTAEVPDDPRRPESHMRALEEQMTTPNTEAQNRHHVVTALCAYGAVGVFIVGLVVMGLTSRFLPDWVSIVLGILFMFVGLRACLRTYERSAIRADL